MTNVLITGGAGFIGSWIVDLLIDKGYKVFIIDDLSTGKKENINSKAEFIKLNILDNKLNKIVSKIRPDIVFHFAAQVSVRDSVELPIKDADINIIGALNVLETSRKNKIKKFIFASTGGAIYGEQRYSPADEKHPVNPVSPYGIAKLSVEKYLHFYDLTYNLKYTALRFGNVYGPRQDPYGEAGVVAIFCNKSVKNIQPIINGDGKQTRDYIYVKDAAEATIKAINLKESRIINIGTSTETDVNYLFKKIKKLSGSNLKEKHGPAKLGEQRRSCLDITFAKRLLKWSPKVSIDEGLKFTLDWFKNKIKN